MAGDYTITGQPLVYQRDPATGRVVEGREIEFRDLVTGHAGRVFVALTAYTPEHVDQLIGAELAKIRAVQGLSTATGAGGG